MYILVLRKLSSALFIKCSDTTCVTSSTLLTCQRTSTIPCYCLFYYHPPSYMSCTNFIQVFQSESLLNSKADDSIFGDNGCCCGDPPRDRLNFCGVRCRLALPPPFKLLMRMFELIKYSSSKSVYRCDIRANLSTSKRFFSINIFEVISFSPSTVLDLRCFVVSRRIKEENYLKNQTEAVVCL